MATSVSPSDGLRRAIPLIRLREERKGRKGVTESLAKVIESLLQGNYGISTNPSLSTDSRLRIYQIILGAYVTTNLSVVPVEIKQVRKFLKQFEKLALDTKENADTLYQLEKRFNFLTEEANSIRELLRVNPKAADDHAQWDKLNKLTDDFAEARGFLQTLSERVDERARDALTKIAQSIELTSSKEWIELFTGEF